MQPAAISTDLLGVYAFYAALLVAKMLPMGLLTARKRFATGVFANPEDAGKKKVAYDNGDVERVRRAHQNDLENILMFFVISALYLLTGPAAGTAKILFRVFVAARYTHTIVYLMGWQPHRVLAYIVGLLVEVYMVYAVISSFCQYM